MTSHATYVFGLKSSPAGYGTIELTQGPSNRLFNQALESRRTAWEQGKESLSFCGRGSGTRGGTGRSGVRGSGPPNPCRGGAVGDATGTIRAGPRSAAARPADDVWTGRSTPRSQSRLPGISATERKRGPLACADTGTAHERSLSRHSCVQAPGNAVFRATNRCARASKS